MIAELNIQTALRGNRTYLESVYCTQPFKIADVTENKKEETLHLMMMNASPGILDGDEYHIQVRLAAGTSLKLFSQSYQRLFAMHKSASQTMEVHQDAGSSFYFLPHPVVPHERSSFYADNKIFLSEDCTLVWGEVLTCGRKLYNGLSSNAGPAVFSEKGEIFRFSKYHNVTQIYINNKLVMKENLLIDPSAINVNAIGQLEGYTHQATFIYMNKKISVNEVVKEIGSFLATENIVFGISAAPANGFIVRLLGYKAEQLYNCLKLIAGKIIIPSSKKSEYAG